MGSELALLIVLIIFLLTLFFGLHISSVLILTGAVGVFLIVGINPVSFIIQMDTFSTVASYSLTTIPLFVLMSQFIVHSDIVKYLYSLLFILSRGNGGLMGVFTVILGGFLGAVSGSASAMSAALGQLGVPELQKRGYNDRFAASIAAAGGSLATIIPPSIGLIIYGAITQTSISSLFMGALIPGLLLIVILSVIIFVIYLKEVDRTSDNDQAFSTVREYSNKNYIVSIITALAIMVSIFGGIYLGVFTPTEAGGVGAFITLIAAIILGKANREFISESIKGTLRISTMVLMIMVGATIFSRFVILSQVPQRLIEILSPIMDSPVLIIGVLVVIFFIAFMFLEGAAAIVMLVPITLPLAIQAGLTPLEFGIIISVLGTAGLITPPVGISVYSVSGVTNIPANGIFKYTLIYAIAISIFGTIILYLFPELINWIPESMAE